MENENTILKDKKDGEATKLKKLFSNEKKVKIRIPIDSLNKKDTTVPVCVNGYIFKIMRGVEVEVPEPIKQILIEGGYI